MFYNDAYALAVTFLDMNHYPAKNFKGEIRKDK